MLKSLRAGIALAALAIPGSAFAFPIAAPGTEGFTIIVASLSNIIATYQGNSASYSNDLYLENTGGFVFNNQTSPVGSTVDLGSFAIGTELKFSLRVNDTGDIFYTGPGSRNSDGSPHARVQTGWQPGETLVSFEDLDGGPFDYNDLSFSFTNTQGGAVPEPAAWAMMIAGFGIAGASLRRRKTAVSFA